MTELEQNDFHKEIDLLQTCIARMARNSTMLKTWTASLVAAGIALTKDISFSWNHLLLFVVPLSLFWFLDGFFLDVETRFRKIYEWSIVERKNGNWSNLFDLNPRTHPALKDYSGSAQKQMNSTTLRAFYGIPALVLIAYSAILFSCESKVPNYKCHKAAPVIGESNSNSADVNSTTCPTNAKNLKENVAPTIGPPSNDKKTESQ